MQFDKTNYVVREGVGSVDIRVIRLNGTDRTSYAHIEVHNGTAKCGIDFERCRRHHVHFENGEVRPIKLRLS